MTEEREAPSVMDPTQMWRKWYETGMKMFPAMSSGAQGNYMDPSGLYRQWFEGLRQMQQRMMGTMPWVSPAASNGGSGAPAVQDLWQRWSEAATDSLQKGAELGQNAMEIMPRWMQMLEEAQNNLLAAGSPPTDPLQLATQWYNATSGPFSDFVGDVIEREEFLEPSSRFLQNYASFYKVYKRNSEEYLKNLQLPVRSDITRVAGLIVNLEDKVDRIEEVLEDFEYGNAEPATAESVQALETTLKGIQKTSADAATAEAVASLEERIGGIESTLDRLTEAGPGAASPESVQTLEGRLDSVENKLDRLLAVLENNTQNGGSQSVAQVAETNGSPVEVKATDAARRKALEMGVDLATVSGSGADGQVTVDDVRKKGDS